MTHQAPSPRRIAFLLPGPLERLTGGTIYDRHIVDGLRRAHWQVDLLALAGGFPWPDAAARDAAARRIALLPDGTCVVADGLAFGAIPEIAQQHARRLHWVALVHHPLALETGLTEPQQQQLFASERRALAAARGVIVTSNATATALADYGVRAAHVHIVEPGTAPAPLATAWSGNSGPRAACILLCVATLTPRKGHALLLDALAGLSDRNWTLHCIGDDRRDAATAGALRARIATLGLETRVRLHGELDHAAVQALYQDADVFVLPSYYEGYGMALAEALARGLPVISTTGGAIADTVPPDAGVLVPPGDSAALQAALARLLDEPHWRAQLAAGAARARTRQHDWPVSVERFAAALDTIHSGAVATPVP